MPDLSLLTPMPKKKYANDEERKAAKRARDRLAYAANPEPHRARSRNYQATQRQGVRISQLIAVANIINELADQMGIE